MISWGEIPDNFRSITMLVKVLIIPVFIVCFSKYLNLLASANFVKISSIKKLASIFDIFSILSVKNFSSVISSASDAIVATLKLIHPLP